MNFTDVFFSAEKARIQAAGGFVDFGRVNGNLALSRAIGDFEFKKSAELPPEHQIVTAFPDVEIHEINEDDEFLVVACDGMATLPISTGLVANAIRHLGLPIFTGGGRVCSTRDSGQAGSCGHMRELDG